MRIYAVGRPAANQARRLLLAVVFVVVAVTGLGCGGSNNDTSKYSNLVGTNAVPEGPWGSKIAELDVSQSNSVFKTGCGQQTLNGPITPDVNGNFTITGTYQTNVPPQNVTYTGHAADGVMQLTITNSSNTVLATFTLDYGVTGEVVFTGCP